MEAIRFIEQAYWAGWLKGLVLGGFLGVAAVWAIFRWEELKLAWRMMRR